MAATATTPIVAVMSPARLVNAAVTAVLAVPPSANAGEAAAKTETPVAPKIIDFSLTNSIIFKKLTSLTNNTFKSPKTNPYHKACTPGSKGEHYAMPKTFTHYLKFENLNHLPNRYPKS